MKQYIFQSKLAPYIEGLISEKICNGYSYQFESYILNQFDKLVFNSEYDNGEISQNLIERWSLQTFTESINYRNQRISFIRQLSKYILSLGGNAYIPKSVRNTPASIPFILTKEELQGFIKVVDNYVHDQPSLRPIAASYSILFRLYICCGLRLSEGTNLLVKNIDLDNGIINVIHSKGNKDRKVFIADDLCEMCKNYDSMINSLFPYRTWFFLSSHIDKPLHKTSLDTKFKFFWKKSGFERLNGKNPTIHSLRHTYVVMCMNKWMEKGIDIQVMMPYLSRQLGHSSLDGTQYYYHSTVASAKIIKKIDSSSNKIIPQINHFQPVEPF
jgi:integrase